jgi:hypothetical protein
MEEYFILKRFNSKWGIWRIGDGKNVNVWGDNWLPKSASSDIYSPKPGHIQNMKVCDLIDWEQQQWRKPLVTTIFFAGGSRGGSVYAFKSIIP